MLFYCWRHFPLIRSNPTDSAMFEKSLSCSCAFSWLFSSRALSSERNVSHFSLYFLFRRTWGWSCICSFFIFVSDSHSLWMLALRRNRWQLWTETAQVMENLVVMLNFSDYWPFTYTLLVELSYRTRIADTILFGIP